MRRAPHELDLALLLAVDDRRRRNRDCRAHSAGPQTGAAGGVVGVVRVRFVHVVGVVRERSVPLVGVALALFRAVRCRMSAAAPFAPVAGLGGGYMAIVGAGIFVPFMTKGIGFIAIVVAMLARGRATWVVIGSLLFGMSVSLTTSLQLIGVEVAQDVVNMIPFIVVMIALVAFARRAYLPAALATPYQREAR